MKKQRNTILLVEDDIGIRELMLHAFQSLEIKDQVHAVAGGEEAISYLNGEGKFADRQKYEFPTTIITDLDMPDGDGFAVLEHLKSDPRWRVIPIIMLSGSADTDDIKQAYLLGVSTFFTKPDGFADLKKLLLRLVDYWSQAEVPQVDESGRMLPTESLGKRGARFHKT